MVLWETCVKTQFQCHNKKPISIYQQINWGQEKQQNQYKNSKKRTVSCSSGSVQVYRKYLARIEDQNELIGPVKSDRKPSLGSMNVSDVGADTGCNQ